MHIFLTIGGKLLQISYKEKSNKQFCTRNLTRSVQCLHFAVIICTNSAKEVHKNVESEVHKNVESMTKPITFTQSLSSLHSPFFPQIYHEVQKKASLLPRLDLHKPKLFMIINE